MTSNQQLTNYRPGSALAAFSPEEEDAIRQSLCPGATKAELSLFAHVCKARGLSPFANQIIMQIRTGKQGRRATFITTIDAFRAKAAATGSYAGNDEVTFEEDQQGIYVARATVWRMVHGVRVAFVGVARWREYCPDAPADQMWRKMPYTMLGKCAEALALRKAFPEELSDLHTSAEMDQAEPVAPMQSIAPSSPALDRLSASEPEVEMTALRRKAGRCADAFFGVGVPEEDMLKMVGKQSLDELTLDDLLELSKRFESLRGDVVEAQT